jgi:hypothetical protein
MKLLNKGGLPPTGLSQHNVNLLAHDEMVKILFRWFYTNDSLKAVLTPRESRRL